MGRTSHEFKKCICCGFMFEKKDMESEQEYDSSPIVWRCRNCWSRSIKDFKKWGKG